MIYIRNVSFNSSADCDEVSPTVSVVWMFTLFCFVNGTRNKPKNISKWSAQHTSIESLKYFYRILVTICTICSKCICRKIGYGEFLFSKEIISLWRNLLIMQPKWKPSEHCKEGHFVYLTIRSLHELRPVVFSLLWNRYKNSEEDEDISQNEVQRKRCVQSWWLSYWHMHIMD